MFQERQLFFPNTYITFNITTSAGLKYEFKDNINNILKSSANKFMQESGLSSLGYEFEGGAFQGNRLELKKSLFDNNIRQGSNILYVIKLNPERVLNKIKTFHEITLSGIDFNGKIKTNQDTTLIKLNIGGIPGFNLFGVLDGHGQYGHFVAQFCRDYFIKKMEEYAYFCKMKNLFTPEQIYYSLKNNVFIYIVDIFKFADIEMTQQSTFDYYSSGTTCNLVIQLNKNLICANVGNSRAILIYEKNSNGNTGICPISRDHTPEIPQEYQRIINNGGTVDQYIDKNGKKLGHNRIYKKGQKTPGIRISRALGDLNAKSCGVINIPEITEYYLNNNSKYMVICSDGIWEIMSNEYISDLGNAYYKKGEIILFCNNLIQVAKLNWKNKYSDYRDDIAIVCVYF